MQITKPTGYQLALVLLLNATPLLGIALWGWQSFELIFLYWFENVVIGVFTVLRFLVRPYPHRLMLVIPLFFVPFFSAHYGAFCYGHGSFLAALFGDDSIRQLSLGELTLTTLTNNQLWIAALALIMYQLIDWIRGMIKSGLGSDSVIELMTAPYRRIIVLHLTIIASGFALSALDEPIIGLVILVILKTGFDLYHTLKQPATKPGKMAFAFNQRMQERADAFLLEPKVVINGRTIHFDNYEDFKASKYYPMMQAIVSLAGGQSQWRELEQYIQQRSDTGITPET